jgi:hypothetical protein
MRMNITEFLIQDFAFWPHINWYSYSTWRLTKLYCWFSVYDTLIRALFGEISCNKSQFILLCRHAVVQLVEALHYRLEDRGFDAGSTIFLGSNQFVKKWIPGKLVGIKAADAYGWQPCHLHVPTVYKFWEPYWPVQARKGIVLPSHYTYYCLWPIRDYIQWAPVGSESVSEPPFPLTKLRRAVDLQATGKDREQEARNVILTFLPREINTNPVV